MPFLSGLQGRLLIAFTLILFCVAVGFAVVLGSGGSQRPTAAGFGDLAATVEARRTATAPTATATSAPTLQPTAPSARLTVGVDSTQAIPLLTIGNQGDSVLDWRLWGIYHSPLGSAKPLQVAVLGADAFDTFSILEADPELARDFRFVNEGDDWEPARIQAYDLLVVSEPQGRLSRDEVMALADFQASGRGVIMGIGPFDDLPEPVYNLVRRLFGADSLAPQAFVPGALNSAHALGQGVALAPQAASARSLHLTSAEWVVQGRNGATFVAAQEAEGRTVLFGGTLAAWMTSNSPLVREALHWAGNGWLFIRPLVGQVPPRSSQVITALLDTSGFFAGSHTVDVVVESNDPATPRLRVPMHLTASGEPRLDVGGVAVAFSPVYVGYDSVRSLRIHNPGVAELEVALTVDDTALRVQPQRFVVGPRASQAVTVTFRPGFSQTLASTIRIATNDPISPTWQVAVTGQGIAPPLIALLPVDQGQVLTRTFTTTNAQIEVGAPQVEWPTSAPTLTPTATISPTTSSPATATPNPPGGPTARLTPAGNRTPTIQAAPATTVAPTNIATATPTAQPSVVATHSNTPSSTATPGPPSDPTPAATGTPTGTPTAAALLLLARSRGENGIPEVPILALPDGNAAVLASLAPGAIFLASARTQATDWLYGHTTGMTLTGWIAVQQLILIGDPQRLPIQTP